MILSGAVALILLYCRFVYLCQALDLNGSALLRSDRATLMAWTKFQDLWKNLGDIQTVVDKIWRKVKKDF